MKTLYKMAVILLVLLAVSGCVVNPSYGYGSYGGQGYGYQRGYSSYGYGYRPSAEPYGRHAWTQIGPYAGRGGFERRHACTQYGVGCIR